MDKELKKIIQNGIGVDPDNCEKRWNVTMLLARAIWDHQQCKIDKLKFKFSKFKRAYNELVED